MKYGFKRFSGGRRGKDNGYRDKRRKGHKTARGFRGFAGAEIILEGGSVKRKFFVISAGGRTVGISLDIANSITVEKLRADTQGLRNLDGQNYSENGRILRAESTAHIRGGV